MNVAVASSLSPFHTSLSLCWIIMHHFLYCKEYIIDWGKKCLRLLHTQQFSLKVPSWQLLQTGWVEKGNKLSLYNFVFIADIPYLHTFIFVLFYLFLSFLCFCCFCSLLPLLRFSHALTRRNCVGGCLAWLVDWLHVILTLNGYWLAL